MKSTTPRISGRPSIVLLLLLLVALQGCADSPATLTVRSTERKIAWEQTFARIYGSKSDDGTWRFVLISDDAARQAAGEDPGAPLRPLARKPLRQVVSIKVLWRPLPGTDTTCADNADVEWYVMSDAPSAAGNLLEYRGRAFVTVRPHGNIAHVAIRAGTMSLLTARGELRDPIGPSNLSGEFTAVENDAALNEILADTRARSAAGAGIPTAGQSVTGSTPAARAL